MLLRVISVHDPPTNSKGLIPLILCYAQEVSCLKLCANICAMTEGKLGIYLGNFGDFWSSSC